MKTITESFDIDVITASPYVQGIRKEGDYKVLDIGLPRDWDIPDKFFPVPVETNINQMNDDGGAWARFIIFSKAKSFSEIYCVLLEVVTYNQEREEKLLILNNMQREIQNCFDVFTLAEFSNLKITGYPYRSGYQSEKTETIEEPAPKPSKKNDRESIKP